MGGGRGCGPNCHLGKLDVSGPKELARERVRRALVFVNPRSNRRSTPASPSLLFTSSIHMERMDNYLSSLHSSDRRIENPSSPECKGEEVLQSLSSLRSVLLV